MRFWNSSADPDYPVYPDYPDYVVSWTAARSLPSSRVLARMTGGLQIALLPAQPLTLSLQIKLLPARLLTLSLWRRGRSDGMCPGAFSP